jgi:gamma-glutamyltranspeptidase/glutathione hydrolase
MEPAAYRHCRPAIGPRGAVAAAHPLATSAATEMLTAGGNAMDAAVAAQAVICVTMPHAAGLGGDLLALVHLDGEVTAVNGTGISATAGAVHTPSDGGGSVTVPGLAHAWLTAHDRWGQLEFAQVLAPAIRLAEHGYRIDDDLARAVATQGPRISRHGADRWRLLSLRRGDVWYQPELATLLRRLIESGSSAFYAGSNAEAIANAVSRTGGALSVGDLGLHTTEVLSAPSVQWGADRLYLQPPSTQGALLGLAASWLDRRGHELLDRLDHVMVEATESAFGFRDMVSSDELLLKRELVIDLDRAARRGGPRAYLHTAGVAAADADGMVVSSLISVFDDFGSGVYVPELGMVLNNRAAGFTAGGNAAAPGKKPVHTLAPALTIAANGDVAAIATPGADGQVQTILQVLARQRFQGLALDQAIASPRWRSEGGSLLIEDGHSAASDLARRGHQLAPRLSGDDVFGAIVAAGTAAGAPYAAADWRRNVSTGAA